MHFEHISCLRGNILNLERYVFDYIKRQVLNVCIHVFISHAYLLALCHFLCICVLYCFHYMCDDDRICDRTSLHCILKRAVKVTYICQNLLHKSILRTRIKAIFIIYSKLNQNTFGLTMIQPCFCKV